MSSRRLLCLDFDGVLHSYVTPWQGADVIADPPVPGAMEAVAAYTDRFRVAVHSSRSAQPGGIEAMKAWLLRHLEEWDAQLAQAVMDRVEWPTAKPPAFLTLDDRAMTFTDTWPSVTQLAAFEPWNKRPPEEDARTACLVCGAVQECLTNMEAFDEANFDPWRLRAALKARGLRIVRFA